MYYELLTEVSMESAGQQIASNPKDAKVSLAKLVIADYHGAAAAEEAANRWQSEIGGKSLPTDIPEVTIPRAKASTLKLVELVYNELKLTDTSSDARRLIGQGGVWIDDRENKLTDINAVISLTDGMILAAGKKKIVRVRLVD